MNANRLQDTELGYQIVTYAFRTISVRKRKDGRMKFMLISFSKKKNISERITLCSSKIIKHCEVDTVFAIIQLCQLDIR